MKAIDYLAEELKKAEPVIDFLAEEEGCLPGFDKYGFAILKREDVKAARQAKHARMALLVSSLKAKAAGAGR